MDGGRSRAGGETQGLFPDLDLGVAERRDAGFWVAQLRQALNERSVDAESVAEWALNACPGDPGLLLLAAIASLVGRQPTRALVFLKRFGKRYLQSAKEVSLLTAIALAQQGRLEQAWTLLRREQLTTLHEALPSFPGDREMVPWLQSWLGEIQRAARERDVAAAREAAIARKAARKATPRPARAVAPPPPVTQVPDLPRLETGFEVRFALTNPESLLVEGAPDAPAWFRLRGELAQLGLVQGFDELLCLPALTGVETHWYQVETVRKVLRQFRGRVLLADEVGLGKTIEAGMVLKEYMLRGMAERVLILTPAALVGQWRDEMAAKFGIDCATTHDPLLRADPAAFWAQPRLIASIAAARRKEHAELLAGLSYDVVVVDEAHHLKDPSSASYRLVNSLQKRFLLLLSATPVQNSLFELYHLLTLLQPGIFKTQKGFKATYMTQGKPREPANRERLRELMRGVMVRNTRALAALRLPRRHAATLRATPGEAEAACYRDLSALAREAASAGPRLLALQHLLTAAGSSPAAACGAITRFAQAHQEDPRWPQLLARYRRVASGAKEASLLALLARNPAERKMVFVHHRESLAHLAQLLRARGVGHVTFDGSMTGPEKDAAVEAFRSTVPVLLCSESGGEGRNLQFCNTLINFDIPWNPMAIEQRIGRIDRIGQTREVFVFNLATSGTIEDEVLRILDEKINMFELVVGEVGAILGEVEDQPEFSTLVLDAWLESTGDGFAALEGKLLAARRQYEDAKQLDDALFGDDFEAA